MWEMRDVCDDVGNVGCARRRGRSGNRLRERGNWGTTHVGEIWEWCGPKELRHDTVS